MPFKSPPKIGYVLLVLQGAVSVLVPRKAIGLATAAWRLGFENVGELRAREWYVETTRVLGVGMIVAGLTGLLVSARQDPSDGTVDSEDDDSGGPIQVNVD